MKKFGMRCTVILFFISLVGGCGLKAKPRPPQVLVPEAPTLLRAQVEAQGVRLSFTLPTRNRDGSGLTDLEIIEVQRASIEEEECPTCPTAYTPVAQIRYEYPQGEVLPSGRMSLLDRPESPGSYRYRVLAINAKGTKSRPSAPVGIFWDVPPAAPRSLEAVAGDQKVSLRWEPVTQRADAQSLEKGSVVYQVFRAREGGEFGVVPLTSTPIEEPEYIDTAVQNGVDYSYKVRALRKVREKLVPGPFSQVVHARPQRSEPPEPPRGLVGFPTPSGVRLVWEGGPGKGVLGYNVYRADSGEGPWKRINSEIVSVPFFDDLTPVRGKSYWYSVTTVDDSEPPLEGKRSEAIRVHVPAAIPQVPGREAGKSP